MKEGGREFLDDVYEELEAAESYADEMHEKAHKTWIGRAGVYSWLSAAFRAGIEWQQNRKPSELFKPVRVIKITTEDLLKDYHERNERVFNDVDDGSKE